jgi:hypothetical protein
MNKLKDHQCPELVLIAAFEFFSELCKGKWILSFIISLFFEAILWKEYFWLNVCVSDIRIRNQIRDEILPLIKMFLTKYQNNTKVVIAILSCIFTLCADCSILSLSLSPSLWKNAHSKADN